MIALIGAGPAAGPASAEVQILNRVVVYPLEAIAQRWEGTSELEVRVDRNGLVLGVRNSSGHPILDWSARISALRWSFDPRQVDGRPVPQKWTAPIEYKQ